MHWAPGPAFRSKACREIGAFEGICPLQPILKDKRHDIRSPSRNARKFRWAWQWGVRDTLGGVFFG